MSGRKMPDIRQAQERLHRIDEMRDADQLKQSGKTQREIADILVIGQLAAVPRALLSGIFRASQ